MKLFPVCCALALALSICNMGGKFRLKEKGEANSNSGTSAGNSSAASAERPEPTAAQTAALDGGQTVSWDAQGISWTLPPKWTKMSEEKTSFNWKSPGSWDAAFLLTNISVMDENFPTEISLNATYDQQKSRSKNGEVDELRWLEIDGLKGVQFRESTPDKPDNPRRLQWITFRKFAGQTQMINLMLSTRGQDFASHQDAMYAILYSTKLVH
ncbi:MAG TPA: hypothetical protein VGB17_05255 [Pyrinomonadaceae bacterium]|jgi:hypothetical protein